MIVYNEIDPFAVAWLRQLIAAGHIAPGEVIETSVEDIAPAQLEGLSQFHTFAGIGVWSHALSLARWPIDIPVWTGSCPCQPFSVAGKRGGESDRRHLWPAWARLIDQRRPAVIFGEQVASPDGRRWLDLVSADLERMGYAFGAADLCAASIGAPHIRQRLYFVGVADPSSWRREAGDLERASKAAAREGQRTLRTDVGGIARGVVDAVGGMVDPERARLERHGWNGNDRNKPRRVDAQQARSIGAAGAVGGFWGGADWVHCRDEKWRPVEPGSFPLAHGAAARVGRLRGYGNAIVGPLAATFIEAVMQSLGIDPG